MNKYGKLPNTAQSIKLETYMKDWKIYLSLSALNYGRHSFFNFKVIKKNGFRNLKLIMIDIFFSFSSTFQVFHFLAVLKIMEAIQNKTFKILFIHLLLTMFWSVFYSFTYLWLYSKADMCSAPICNPCPDLKSLLPRFEIPAPICNLLPRF